MIEYSIPFSLIFLVVGYVWGFHDGRKRTHRIGE
jgi:hypothetical protein